MASAFSYLQIVAIYTANGREAEVYRDYSCKMADPYHRVILIPSDAGLREVVWMSNREDADTLAQKFVNAEVAA